jgi:hypothetical protein
MNDGHRSNSLSFAAIRRNWPGVGRALKNRFVALRGRFFP